MTSNTCSDLKDILRIPPPLKLNVVIGIKIRSFIFLCIEWLPLGKHDGSHPECNLTGSQQPRLPAQGLLYIIVTEIVSTTLTIDELYMLLSYK